MLIASSIVGSLPSWILVAIAIAAAVRLTRGGAGSAVTELKTANDVLVKANEDLRSKNTSLTVENETLRHRTDYEGSLAETFAPLVKWTQDHERGDIARHEQTEDAFRTIAEELKAFDQRSELRAQRLMKAETETTERLLDVLAMIANRLGPDPENGN